MISVAVFLVAFVGSLVGALCLLGHGVGQLLPGAERARADRPLRAGAALAGSVASALCALGLFCVGGAVVSAEDGGTDSAPIIPCRTGDAERDGLIVDYAVSYVPLGFECSRNDGTRYLTDDVPGYVNPGIALFGLAGASGAVLVGYRTELRARRAA
ncbi:hypothetical protein GTY65_16130 [Streptomyces sp. SID8379]|uniref:hypothetical protein n=1 Tax=unclassified Streptomyces TaxID=2593676 RepID=UPI00038004DD|nr:MULTISPECIES: hypothetical protein [unclassified Streptomyces]MYW65573.1 hypothetical protein [Streptomyces sp. SID8379]